MPAPHEVIAYLELQSERLSMELLAKTAVLFDLIVDARLLDLELIEPIRQTFHRFVNDLVPHRERERNLLFPMIERHDAGLPRVIERAAASSPRSKRSRRRCTTR
jgi:hypothetical protein